MIRVSLSPPWPDMTENSILSPDNPCTIAGALAEWRRRAAEAGFKIDTQDLCPPDQADVLWFIDLPPRRQEFDRILSAARPGVRTVLHMIESPLIAPASHDPRNHTAFDRILTYNYRLGIHTPRYRVGRIPYPFSKLPSGQPFAQRRTAVMINTNQAKGWTERRLPGKGLAGLPGHRRVHTGWKNPWSVWLNPCPGELYSWRRKLARAADRFPEQVLDVYGKNWRGERIHWWLHPRSRPYRCALNAPTGNSSSILDSSHSSKMRLLAGYRFSIAAENYRGSSGYISEKLLDAIHADTVPVYLGDEQITDLLPLEAFVDARNFRTHRSLLTHLSTMTEEEWNHHRSAGRDWLQSDAAQTFSTNAFADTALKILQEIMPTPPSCHYPSGHSRFGE